ncbi:MAG: hypothetical protein LC794_20295 [Acidobacteria bacterium]|nr:hypothetical protein [Acidobacteriota bacterium]
MALFDLSRLNKASHGNDALAPDAVRIAAARVDHVAPGNQSAWIRVAIKKVYVLLPDKEPGYFRLGAMWLAVKL